MTFRRLFFATLGLLFLAVSSAYAQDTAATLTGAVTDASKAVLPGATVTATDLATGRTYVAVTDDKGDFRIFKMTPGTYKVQAELAGFGTKQVPQLELLVGQRAALSFTLAVATVTESVTVTGESPLVDTASSQVGGNVDRRQMEQLPLSGRNWMSLTMLVKGITANDVSTNPGVSRDELFQLNIDGQQVTQKTAQSRYGQPKFSREAIAEFQLVTQMFEITQGRSTGIQVQAISKSGTNRFSGSGFGFFRSDNFNAPDPLLHYVLPYSDKQMGATLGGPIKRDKLFFFGAYEYEKEPSTAVSTPVYLPGEVFAFPTQNTYHEVLGKVDYRANSNNQVSVRYSYSSLDNPFAGTAGDRYPSVAAIQNQHSTNILGTWSQVMSDKMLGEARIAYTAFSFSNLSPPELTGVRTYSFPGLTVGGASNQPNKEWSGTYQFRYDLNMIRGNHSFKVGTEYLHIRDKGFWHAQAYGVQYFNARPPDLVRRFPADAWNNPAGWDLTGLDAYGQRLDQNFRETWEQNMPRPTVGVWFGDNWRVNNALTINAGIRWDADFGLADPPCVYGNGDVKDCPTSTILIDNGKVSGDFGYKKGHTDLNNFAPRVGFAWKVGGLDGLVIRGGTGLFWNFSSSNVMYIKEYWSSMVSASIVNDKQPGWVLDPTRGLTGSDYLSGKVPLPPMAKIVLDPYYQNPVTWQYSVGFQKQLGSVMAFDADLIGWQWYNDQRNNDQNLFYDPTTGYNKDPRIYGRPNTAYAAVNTVTGSAHRDNLALATSFTRRLRNKFQAGATYTLMIYQHDNNIATTGTTGSSASNPFDLQGEWALSTDFQRSTVRAYGLYQLPWGFSLSGMYLYGSGNRFQTSLSSLGYFGGGVNRMNLGAPITIPAAVVDRFKGPAVIPTGTAVPRNALKGMPLHRVDLRLTYDFKIYGSAKMSLIGEVFNVLNHENFGSYNGLVDSPTFGNPLAIYSFSGLGTAYVPRTGQLAFRLSF